MDEATGEATGYHFGFMNFLLLQSHVHIPHIWFYHLYDVHYLYLIHDKNFTERLAPILTGDHACIYFICVSVYWFSYHMMT